MLTKTNTIRCNCGLLWLYYTAQLKTSHAWYSLVFRLMPKYFFNAKRQVMVKINHLVDNHQSLVRMLFIQGRIIREELGQFF